MSLSARRLQRTARDTARGLDNVTNGRPFTEHLDVFKVGAKVFLIVTDDPAEPIITVKADPDRGDNLRCRHPSIGPGRYLDKTHWISIGPGPGITERLVRELVQDSYDLAR